MKILYLSHRIPYPPNKGDKIRSFHQLQYLAEHGDVALGTLVDHPDDIQHIAALQAYCTNIHVSRLRVKTKKIISMFGHLKGKPASVSYFYEKKLQQWVDSQLAGYIYDMVFCFSSTMAEYVFNSSYWQSIDKCTPDTPRFLMDLCDVDSKKWIDYGVIKKWPMSTFFQHEGKLLQQYEQRIVDTFDDCFLASRREKDIFDSLHPRRDITILENGVDLEFFSNPTPSCSTQAKQYILVFTGAMDYDVNIDGVCWFVEQIWPLVKRREPDVLFYIVGSNPSREILALTKHEGITVTGFVHDIREYYRKATICVAPLRIARGIQNKVIEAMAMTVPVVCTANAFEGINAVAGKDLIVVDDPKEFAGNILHLLMDPAKRKQLSINGRQCMVNNYDWTTKLSVLDRCLFRDTDRGTALPMT